MYEDVYDLCIVGAGMFGSAAARHASTNPGLKACLIGPTEPSVHWLFLFLYADEGKEREIFSSHYDEGRIVHVIDENLPHTVLSKHTISRFRELEKLSGIKFYNPVGFLLTTEKDSKDAINLLQKLLSHDIAFSDLSDGDVFKKRFPYLQMSDCDCRILDDNGAGYVSARRLVEAQKKVARLQGCEMIEDIVREVKDLREGVHQVITEKNGIIRAQRVLISAGAFTNYISLQPIGKVKMVVNQETVAMLRLSEKESEILRSMPTITYMKIKDDFPNLLNGVYILPPMQYPDDTNFEAVSSKTCLTCHNETGLPYIDRVTPTVTVAVVGNGVGAMTSDEVGRIAAELSLNGKWDSELPKNLFEAVLE
ncbi:unnamed protein product [Larinioides sclopetarius]|uniref:FAD dependent oxidoreductase domain-containing protein n=1 Tax=Larinioides sclopetarius TaxID=280406 RepID=A0AAV2ACL7_9ARAC